MNEIASYPSLENKVVIVTGGASGIGESIVEQFVIQKSKVAFIDIEEKLAKNLIERINKKYNTKPLFIKCDLKNIFELKDSIQQVKQDLGPISILINNAANDERHNIDDVTSEYWDDRMNINLKHYFFAIQSVYKDMKKLGKGTIVNIGSFSWMKGQGGMPGYTTAKSAIMGLTRTLARDLGIYNIRVNCIVPGWIITDRQKKLWLTPEIEKQQLEDQCIKRMLVPEDISKAVLFFASDQSSGCTAQNYVIDGGIVH
jgi:NAD(P)-dependent dehydrogenase (short-subunit alcohol dehydrogenase family)|tara:strand:- start:2426 stop:3196 length:771 start_codon:yes stop_codon:yes gene_type:complete